MILTLPLALASLLDFIGKFQERIWELAPTETIEIKKFLEKSFNILGIGFKSETIPPKREETGRRARVMQRP